MFQKLPGLSESIYSSRLGLPTAHYWQFWQDPSFLWGAILCLAGSSAAPLALCFIRWWYPQWCQPNSLQTASGSLGWGKGQNHLRLRTAVCYKLVSFYQCFCSWITTDTITEMKTIHRYFRHLLYLTYLINLILVIFSLIQEPGYIPFTYAYLHLCPLKSFKIF